MGVYFFLYIGFLIFFVVQIFAFDSVASCCWLVYVRFGVRRLCGVVHGELSSVKG